MRKIINKLKVIEIEVYIYEMKQYVAFNVSNFKYDIKKNRVKKKWRYFIKDSYNLIHQSYLFSNVFLLKSLKRKGVVIGDCFTNKKYRGQSIYPYVINRIAKEVLEKETKEVYVIVNQNNLSSILGIEKAGFTKLASIQAKRWLCFYLKRQIHYYK